MFLRVLDAELLPQEKCISLVYTPQNREQDDESAEMIAESFSELSAVSTVIDVSEQRTLAVESIRRGVEEAKEHCRD